MRIEFHSGADDEFQALDKTIQKRISKALYALATLDDPRQRLIPYAASLSGFWKLRVGDYRLVCEIIERDGMMVVIIHVAHRSRVYAPRSEKIIKSRRKDET